MENLLCFGQIAGSRRSIANLAPYLSALVNKRRVKRRTVHEALDQNLWIQDIQGALCRDTPHTQYGGVTLSAN